ncbi:MAG: helix-turn-helix domain-containing protein [Desulfovibrio sp.]
MKQRTQRRSGIHFQLAPDLPGLEILRLEHAPRSEQLGPHAHDSLVLTAVRSGARRLRLGKADRPQECTAGPGECCVLWPGRVHTCAWDAESSADCLCIKPFLLKTLNFNFKIAFPGPVLADARLHGLIRACAASDRPLPALKAVLGRLWELGEQDAGSAATGSFPSARPKASAMADVLERLRRAALAGEAGPCCAKLAREAGLCPWTLSRRFAEAYGAPPRDYALHLRVQAAKQRLAQGMAPALVALEAGFFDQSHFIRRFRALVGLTPGEYAAAFRSAATRNAGKVSP